MLAPTVLTRRPLRLAVTASALVLVAVGLSGCAPNLLGYLEDKESLGYARTCRTIADEHGSDLQRGRYFIPNFDVDRWPGGGAKTVGEPALIDALVAGKSRFALIEARGGLGKTRLAKSIHAQTCGSLPVFTIDLNKDVAEARDADGGNPIIRVIAKQLGLGSDPAGLQQLDALLHSHRWLLLADAIEEVELLTRPRVSIALAKMRQAYPSTAQVVLLARPAVLVPFYGFDDVDLVARIHLVDCERADKVIASLAKSDDEPQRFAAFLARYGLDLRRTLGDKCVYPYMSTYRDIHVLRRLADEAGESGVESYAEAHEALVALRLRKELDRMNWGQREALDMVDRMVRMFRQSSGAGDALFGVLDCMKSIDPEFGWTAVDAGVTGSDPQRRRAVCEKALQSVVFEKTGDGFGEEGRWRFFDPRTAALFRARWLNGELSRVATGDCSLIASNQELLLHDETVRFAVGQPLVQRCFGPLIGALCGGGGATATGLERILEGLPAQARRFQMVEEARAWAVEAKGNACVTASLDVVAKSIGR